MSGLRNMVGAAGGSTASGVAAEGPFPVADAPMGYAAGRSTNTGHMDGASGAGNLHPAQQLPVRRAVTAIQAPELRQFHISRGRMLVDNLPTDIELNVSVVNNPQAPTPFGPVAQMVDVIMYLDIANNTLAIEAFKDNRAIHVRNTLASGMTSSEPGPGGQGGGSFGHNGNHHNDAHGGSGNYYDGSDYGGMSTYHGGNGYQGTFHGGNGHQGSYHGDNNRYQGGYHGGSGYQGFYNGGSNGWQYGPNDHAQGYHNGHDGRADSYQSGGQGRNNGRRQNGRTNSHLTWDEITQGSAARYAQAMRHTAQSTETNGTQRWVHDHRVRMAAEGVILEQPVYGESSRIPDEQGSGKPSRNEPTAVHAGLALRDGTTAGSVVAMAETVDPVLYMPNEGPSSYGPPMGQLPESAGARTTEHRAAGSTTMPMAAVAGQPAGTEEPEMTGFTIKLLNVDGQMQHVLSSPQETKVLTRDHAKARPLAAMAAQAQPSAPAAAPGEGHGATSRKAVAPVAPTPAHNEEAEGAAKLKRARRKASKKAKKVVAEAAGATAAAEAAVADPAPLAEGGGKAMSAAKPPPSEKREGTGAGRLPRGSRAGKGVHKGEASDADVAATAEACSPFGEEEWDSVVSRGAKALSHPWRFADI
ncbi:hypothetical protein [Candidatus Phytoplasma fabacearum]|uniref:hypothetical protein n=1 Tax=Candidatus Phytoplasma fabacearum TaxID=2982628 RepID=UPI0030E7B142